MKEVELSRPRGVMRWLRCGLEPLAQALVVAVCGAVGLLVLFAGVNWGDLTWADEAYQLMCCRQYGECPLAMLTFYDGYMWSLWAGDGVVAMRFFAETMYLLALGVCWLYAWRLTRRAVATAAVALLAALIVRLAAVPVYGWENGPAPFMALGLVATISYMGRPQTWKAVAMGAMAAAITLSRVPLAPVMVVMAAVVIYARRGQTGRMTADLAVGLVACVVVAWLLMVLMCGSVDGFVASCTATNLISGHGMGELLRAIVWTSKMSLPLLLVGATPLLLCLPAAMLARRGRYGDSWRRMLVLMAALAFYGICVERYFATELAANHEAYFWPLYGVALPMLGLALAWPWVKRVGEAQRRGEEPRQRAKGTSVRATATTKAQMWVVVAFMVLPCLGSDQPLNRLINLQWALPLVVALRWPQLTSGDRQLWRWMLALALATAAGMWGAKMLYLSQENPEQHETAARHEHVRGAVGGADDINELNRLIGELPAGRNVEYIGTGRYGAAYAASRARLEELQRFHWVDGEPDTMEAVERAVARHPQVVVLVTRYAQYPQIADTLCARGYHPAAKGEKYVFYKR